MKMEDKLIEEYRRRSVEYRLPLPENGWEKLEAAFAPTPAPAEVRRFPYRWLAAAVSLLAVMGSALYFMGIDKEFEPVLSDIVLPVEQSAGGTPALVVTVEEIKSQPAAKLHATVPALKKVEQDTSDLSEVVSEVYMSISAYFHAEVGEEHVTEGNSYNNRSVVESGRYEYVPEKNYEPLPAKKASSSHGWTFGLYAGNMFDRHSSATGGLQMLNATATRSDVSVNNNPGSGTFEDYMKNVASNESNFRDPGDYSLFEQIAAANYQKPAGTKIKHKFPLSAGLSVKKKLNDRLSVESGLVYTFLSSELSAGEVDFYSQEQRLHYLGIPLKVNYTLWKKDRLSVYASAGAMAEMCVDGSLNTNYYLNNVRERKSKTDLDVNKVQLSALASLGVQYDIAKPVSIYAEPGISYYFDDKSVVETIRKEHPLTASVQFGVRFAF